MTGSAARRPARPGRAVTGPPADAGPPGSCGSLSRPSRGHRIRISTVLAALGAPKVWVREFWERYDDPARTSRRWISAAERSSITAPTARRFAVPAVDEVDLNRLSLARALVPVDLGPVVAVRDDEVGVAVEVEVGGGQAAAHANGADAAVLDLGEPPAQVLQELVRLRVGGVGEAGVVRDVVDHMAVRDHEVQVAVEVEVGEVGAEANPGHRGFGDAGDEAAFEEEAVAAVRVERVRLAVEVGDDQVLQAVAVHVADCDPHAGLGFPAVREGGAGEQGVVLEARTVRRRVRLTK